MTHDEGRHAFLAALDTFASVADELTDRDLTAFSRCRGWTTADVLVHVHLGLQEMLLGLVSPTGEQPDSDASDYWRHQPPSTDDSADEIAAMRFVRLIASAYQRPTGVIGHLRPTFDGLRTAVTNLRPGAVRFQGLVLTTGDFLTTWAVELAVHQLDLRHPTPPAPSALRLGRATVEALRGGGLPSDWDDETVLLLGFGRIEPGDRERAAAAGLPMLG
ncbi:MAG: maleylpyruvate isomerase N-terminal domain-containing protein [Actinoplanes sp.]